MRELGVGLVAYSPLGRGFLTGTVDVATLGAADARRRLPAAFPPPSTLRGRGRRDDQVIADTVRTVAEAKNLTPAQVALAWVTAQAPRLDVPVVPIPGTRRVHRLEQNPAALGVTLSSHELAALGPLACQVVGARYDPRPAAAARRDDNRLP